jgi:hypothetical protein
MSLGYYDTTRLIYVTMTITPHLQSAWEQEMAFLDLNMEMMCDLIEDSIYDCGELLSHFYDEKPRLLRIAGVSESTALDPISCEPLTNDLVVLPGTEVIVNRSTLQTHFDYQGMTNPYTRQPITWEEVNTYTSEKLERLMGKSI